MAPALFATVGGGRLAYLLTGPLSGAPVVFVHGLAASKEAWAAVVEPLAGEYRLLRYDLRGHGASSPAAESCSRADLAAELSELLAVVGMDRAVIVGHSAGGVISMQTTLDFPDRVAGLVLIGTASECNDRTAEWYAASANKARSEGGAAGMRAMGVRSKDVPVPDGATFAAVAHAMRTLNVDPLTERLRSVAVPTLIVVGEKDFLGAGGSVILSRTISDAELEILPGRGHAVHLEDHAWFAARLRRFIGERCSPPRET